jgi:hypothetical protein
MAHTNAVGVFVRTVALVAAALAAAVPCGAQALVDHGPVRSNLDLYGWSAARDCGFSEPLVAQPGSSLWIFCDSVVTRPDQTWYFVTSTAALGPDTPGTAPAGLTELGAFGVPAQFVPAATGIPCPRYTPAWASGALLLPFTTRILITHVSHCVMSDTEYIPKRYGVADWDGASRTFVHNAPAVFASDGVLPAPQRLRSPVYHDGYWYFFANDCTSSALGACTAGSVFVARVAVGEDAANRRPWANPARYRWLGSQRWTASWAEARSVIPGARPSTGVSVDWYPSLGRFVLIEQTSIAGHFRVWAATHPAGPWTLRRSAQVPCAPGSGFCRAVIGHPELSTGGTLALSFFQPADARVHVVTLAY